jgi:hypothetical protein
MGLGRTRNNDYFSLSAISVGEELLICYGGGHIGRVKYESLDVKLEAFNTTRLCTIRGCWASITPQKYDA